MKKPKILIFDIETAPNVVASWSTYGKNWRALEVIKPWYMLCFAYKWLDEKKTHAVALPDFKKEYKKDKENDKKVLEVLWKLLDEADIVIAHNGDAFDIKKTNARFMAHGMKPPSPYKTIDTLKVARKHFKFNSNKLDDLGDYLGVGRKVQTGGYSLWQGCIAGVVKAWKDMVLYNKQDVVLLENVYLKLRPWMTTHPNINIFMNTQYNCSVCGSSDIQRRGYVYTKTSVYQSVWCKEKDCGKWSKYRTAEKILKPEIV